MPTSVTLPDGTEVEFPDSMSPGQIQEVMNRRFRKAPAAPTGPRPVDWNLPPVDYETRKYKAADLLASGAPLTDEQILRGQGTVGSIAELEELNKRRLSIGNQNVPQQQQLDLWRQYYATKGEDPVEYMADRVGFSPTGFVRAWNYRQAKQRFEAGQADYQDVAAIARMEREQQIESEKGVPRQAVDIATRMPGYALETMATMGFAPVARGATTAQKIFSFLMQAGKAGARTALVTPRTYQEAQMRMANGENVVSAHAKALTGQTIDRATELMGGAIPLPKKLEAIGKALKGAWVRKTGLDPSKYNDALARVGVNGVLGELLEERFAEVARGVTVDEDFGTTGDLLTGEFEKAGKQLLAEILASGGIKGASNVMSMIDSAEKNKGKKPAPETLPRATDAYAPEPVGGDSPTSLQQYEQEQNRGKKRVETFGDVVDRQFDPPRVEKARNQDFRTLEPSAFFNEHQGTREAIAALPDSPTRGQFAKALGIPRDAVRSREPINAYIAEARKQQPAAPVQEPPQVSVPSPVEAQPLPAPVQEAAPAAAPVAPAPVPQEAPAPAKPEAWQRAYDQLPADLDALIPLTKVFDIWIPRKGTKARSNLDANELRAQIADAMTARPQGKFQEIQPEPKPLVTARDVAQPPVDVSEFEDAPYQSPKPFSAESGKGVWMPLAKKGKASAPLASRVKNRGKKQPATEEAFTLKKESDALWKGDRPLEDTREEKKQSTFISGLGKDTPATRLLIDTDFEGEVKEQKKAAPAGWGSMEADEEVVRKEAETKTSGAERIINNLRKSGRQAKLVEPSTDFHRDMEKLAREFGLDVAFFDSRARVAGITNANTVAFNVRSAEDNAQDYTWGIVGHEIAHGTGVDQLVDAFGEDLVEEWSKKYYDNVSPDIKKRLDENPDLRQREGVATLIESFMRDPKFRSRLKQNNVSAWGTVVDKVWDVFSGFTPDSKTMKTALEVLKRARSSEQYRENKIREIAADTVSKHAPGSNQEQMVEDFVKLIKEKHRDAVQMFKLREKAKSEAKVKLGLDARLAAKIENKGKDLSSVKNIDTVGRTLVNEYQDLFPGDAEQQDYERIAWDLVSEPRFDTPPDLSQDMIDEAWEQLTGGQDMRGDAWEPDEEQKTLWEDSGFDLFAEEPEKVGIPTKLRNEDVQRAFGRANPATTLAGRLEVMRENLEHNAPLHRPRSVAEAAARKRLEGDGAERERKAFVERFKSGNFNPLSEVDTNVLAKLISGTSVPGALTRGPEALLDLHIMVNGWALSRSEQSRALSLRDPIASGVPLSREARNNKALTDMIFTGIGIGGSGMGEGLGAGMGAGLGPGLGPGKGPGDGSGNGPGGYGGISLGTKEQLEAINELINLLKKNGIDPFSKDLLKDDEKIMKALGLVKAHRDRKANTGWLHFTDMVYEYYLNAILSGPQTHVANFIGNSINSPMINMVERTVEVAVSKATRGKLSDDGMVRDFRELGEMYKAMIPAVMVGLKNARIAFRSEYSPLNLYTGDPGGVMSVLAPSYKIPGKIGKAIRIPFRMLAASDEFARTINAHGAAAIYAYRLGKKNGVNPEDMSEYVAKHVADYTSEVWHDAMKDAAYAAFQQDGGLLSRELKGIANHAKGSKSLVLRIGSRALFPFSTFMINSFGRAADLMPGLGVIVAGINQFDDKSKVNWNRVAGNQLIGMAVMAAVGAAVAGGDNEDGLPLITGTKERNVAKRGLQYQTAPPMSILVNGKYYSYARIEPINSLLAAMVDFLEKGDPGKNGSAMGALLNQLNDKNYTQGIEDIIRVVNEEQSWMDLPAKTAAGFVPNVYRQPVREARNIVTESRFRMSDSAIGKIKKLGVQMEVPWIDVSYRYDIWGEPMRTNAYSTSLPYRILSPVKVKDIKDIFPASLALMQWNDNPENEPFYPELPARSVKYNGEEITNEQYSEYAQEAGKIAKGFVKDKEFSNPPTQAEINYIKKTLEVGRKKAKANLMERLSRRNGK